MGLVLALPLIAGLWAFCGGQTKASKTVDPYHAAYDGWELRPLEKARREGKLVFQSDFSDAGLVRDWTVDGLTVGLTKGAAVLSLSPDRIGANRKYGVLWSRAAFAEPQMIEVEFTLDPASLHDANIFWGQKEPAADALGQDQECFITSCFGWGGLSSGLEGVRSGPLGITATVAPRPGRRYAATWIIRGRIQCLYLDGTLLVYSQSPKPPPASGLLGLSVFQSKVAFHSVRVYSLGAEQAIN
jgi:hypothetical protein